MRTRLRDRCGDHVGLHHLADASAARRLVEWWHRSSIRSQGLVMTDSGAFQQHAYGSVEVTPEEIVSFQNTIGATSPPFSTIFTEPEG